MAIANGPKLGYDDLNKLMEKPSDMLFRIGELIQMPGLIELRHMFPFTELLSVELPQSYKKETWQMDENEKITILPRLKDEGNQLYKEKKIDEASKLYAQAIGILEQLQLK